MKFKKNLNGLDLNFDYDPRMTVEDFILANIDEFKDLGFDYENDPKPAEEFAIDMMIHIYDNWLQENL